MRQIVCSLAGAALCVVCSTGVRAQHPAPPTDLDALMAQALTRRDVDRETLGDYVLDESESFEIAAPERPPIVRMRRDYTWYVRDGIHVRSPVKVDGVPVPEADRRAYEQRWYDSEVRRRAFRADRDGKDGDAGTAAPIGAPSANEPRFVSESYFMDFRFEPGNYYLAGKELLDGHDVLRIDYVPTGLEYDNPVPHPGAPGTAAPGKVQKERQKEQAVERKMDKTAQVTMWVDPATHQIAKYTFDNVWLNFMPASWLVRVDGLRASMEMTQPFPGVWLPRTIEVHSAVTAAIGSVGMQYRREFSNYRRADVTSKIKIAKDGGGRRDGGQ